MRNGEVLVKMTENTIKERMILLHSRIGERERQIKNVSINTAENERKI